MSGTSRTTINAQILCLQCHYGYFGLVINDFSNRWCKRENVEPDALKEWKINIFKIIDTRISF